jgi:hypothetical protein
LSVCLPTHQLVSLTLCLSLGLSTHLSVFMSVLLYHMSVNIFLLIIYKIYVDLM